MLFDALKLIQSAFHAYISEVEDTPPEQDILVIDSIPASKDAGGTQDNLDGKVVMSLVNLQEEIILKASPHHQQLESRTIHENPLTSLNLFVLFSVVHRDQYEASLQQLSRVIEFFQWKQVFASADSTSASTELSQPIRVYADLYSLSFEQLEHLWRSLGGKQEPFALYKLRVVAIEARGERLDYAKIVATDFCAPQRCCGAAQTMSYLLAKPRPIVFQLEKSKFCEDDGKRYEFILEPTGGTLKGDGSFLDEGKYYFQPSRIDRDIVDDETIIFTYAVEGRHDTFVVTVYPQPTGELSIQAEQAFCDDADPVEITLIDSEPSVHMTHVKIDRSRAKSFDPSRFAKDPSLIVADGNYQLVLVEAFLRDRRTNCRGVIRFNVKVYPQPDTAFQILPTGFTPHPGLPDNTYCAAREPNSKFLLLQPQAPATSAYFTVNGNRVPQQNDAAGATINRLDISNFGQREAQELVIVHHTVEVGACLARTSEPQTITITPLPKIAMAVGGREQFCNDESAVPLTFNSRTSLIPLAAIELVQVTIDGQVVSDEVKGQLLTDVQLTFEPSQFAQGQDAQSVTIEVQFRDRNTRCENSVATTVTVHPLPNANFRLNPPTTTGGYCAEAGSIVTLEAEDSSVSERFEVTGDVDNDILAAAQEQDNQITLAKLSVMEPTQLTITHQARNAVGCIARSAKTITVYPIPSAAFELATTNVCSTDAPVAIRVASLADSYELRAVTADGTVIETAIQPDLVDANTLQFSPIVLHPDGTTNYFGESYALPITLIYEVTGAGGCRSSQSREIVVYRTPEADFDIAFVGEVTPNGATVQVTNIQPQAAIEALSFQWDTNGGSQISQGDQNSDFTVTYNPDELRDRDAIVITLTVFNLGGNLSCSRGPIEKRLTLPDVSGNPFDELLDDRFIRYRNQLVALAPDLNLADTAPDDLANRFLTVDRTLDEERAIGLYTSRVRAFISRFLRDGGSLQAASELVMISTASLFDRLVVGDVTTTVVNSLRESLTEFQEVGIDLTQLLSIWNPSELVNLADSANLTQLQTLIQDITDNNNDEVLNALLEQRFTRYRNQLVVLAPDLGQANASPNDLVDRFLTVNNPSLSELQAVGLYARNVESFVRSFLRSGGSNQAASELVALSTASLLDRLLVGDVTNAVENQLVASLTEFQGIGINLNRIPGIWNPAELAGVADTAKLAQLQTLLP
ncbi:MAG: DUF4255 domain-containing protein [Cyanobacteria bacterium J06638_28]